MLLPILIIIIAVSSIIMVVFALSGKAKSGWIQFYAKGKDSGFSFREIDLLRHLAIKSHLEDPSSLYWSQNQLDVCIKSFVRNIHLSGEVDKKPNQDFLEKLYNFRKKIEMEKPRFKNGISNSRQIGEGQALRILVPGSGVFKSQVIKNTSGYLTISRPMSNKLPGTFSWYKNKISVYFWRDDDAGYVFDSEVMDEVFSKGISSIKITHGESLFRTQKRKSVRVRLHKSAFLYPLANEDDVNKIEVNPGIKCFLEDLSDTGCAITIGGKGQAGLRIKIQFALNNTAIVMGGTVRSIDYNDETNKSILHVEADPLPIEIRNQILGEVFGMLPEEEDDLPFRMLAEEAEDAKAMNYEEPEFSPEASEQETEG
ncbi:MAG: PilZ domain-containing protein [Treponema sp.]|nr:PilZ domain-containing protein [Treponema sp.]